MATDGSMESATLGRRISIRFHLILCAPCRQFLKQIHLIGRLARERTEAEIDRRPLPERFEEKLVRALRGAAGEGRS